MLYKVTPMMVPAPKKAREAGAPRKRRKSAVYDHEGNEVLISLMCFKCKQIRPLAQFGLRKMADGAIRNQPWCRPCRSAAGAPKPKREEAAQPAQPLAAQMGDPSVSTSVTLEVAVPHAAEEPPELLLVAEPAPVL